MAVDVQSLRCRAVRLLRLALRRPVLEPGAGGRRLPRRRQLASGVDFLLSLHPPGPGFTPVAEARGVHETVKLARVEDPLPRAFVVAGTRPAEGQAAFDALVSDAFDPRGEVVLPPGAPSSAPGAAGRIEALRLGLDRVAIDVTLERPGYVVLLEAWDPGWRATVDGVAAEVLTANLVFRAVRVEAGRHQVTMRYRPRELALGAAVSALALALAAALAWCGPRRTAGRRPNGAAGATIAEQGSESRP